MRKREESSPEPVPEGFRPTTTSLSTALTSGVPADWYVLGDLK